MLIAWAAIASLAGSMKKGGDGDEAEEERKRAEMERKRKELEAQQIQMLRPNNPFR